MKNLIALTLILMTTAAHAVMIDSGNNMGAEQAPKRDHSTYTGVTDTNRRTYGEESTGMRDDTISTGQASTKRETNRSDTSVPKTQPTARCVDSSGYSYYKNDSGYANCVNQSSHMMKAR